MSVLILQGPGVEPAPLPPRARWGDHELQSVRCRNVDALVAGLQAVRGGDIALVLLDGGHLARPQSRAAWPRLRQALDQLPVPYIELETDAADELEPWLHPRHLPLATLVTPDNRAQGYAMSQAIALRRLAATDARGEAACRS